MWMTMNNGWLDRIFSNKQDEMALSSLVFECVRARARHFMFADTSIGRSAKSNESIRSTKSWISIYIFHTALLIILRHEVTMFLTLRTSSIDERARDASMCPWKMCNEKSTRNGAAKWENVRKWTTRANDNEKLPMAELKWMKRIDDQFTMSTIFYFQNDETDKRLQAEEEGTKKWWEKVQRKRPKKQKKYWISSVAITNAISFDAIRRNSSHLLVFFSLIRSFFVLRNRTVSPCSLEVFEKWQMMKLMCSGVSMCSC